MSTIVILSDREIEQQAAAAAARVEADCIAVGMSTGRAMHEAAYQYDITEAALLRQRAAILNGTAR
jgi:hypothetical protein